MKDKYIRQAVRKMRVSPKRKAELRRDLEEIFASAAEHGETEAEVIERLGTPGEYAAGVSGQTGGRKGIFRIVCIAATAAAASCSLFLSLITRTTSVILSPGEGASVGIIGGADGPTQIFVTNGPQDPSRYFLVAGVVLLALAVLQIVLYVRKKRG